MPKNQVYYGLPKMQGHKYANYDQVPIMANSRSYQQPVSEAREQTEYALMQRKRHGQK